MGFILFLVAFILTGFVFVLSVVFTPIYYITTFKWKSGLKRFNEYWRQLAISIDQFGNGACGKFLEYIMIKKSLREKCYHFGNIDETVSFVLGVNYNLQTLNLFGLLIVWLLHILDENHVEKAVEFQKNNDLRAKERYEANGYGK